MSSSAKTPDYPLVREGGLPPQPSNAEDPFKSFDDLMAVVEALCPTWPERAIFSDSARFLL